MLNTIPNVLAQTDGTLLLKTMTSLQRLTKTQTVKEALYQSHKPHKLHKVHTTHVQLVYLPLVPRPTTQNPMHHLLDIPPALPVTTKYPVRTALEHPQLADLMVIPALHTVLLGTTLVLLAYHPVQAGTLPPTSHLCLSPLHTLHQHLLPTRHHRLAIPHKPKEVTELPPPVQARQVLLPPEYLPSTRVVA